MSPEWRDYQEEVASFFRAIGLNAATDQVIEGVRSKHAIDVRVTFEKWGIRHLWIVECKNHVRPITKADVETLKSIASEVGATLAFLISKAGFQPGAIDAARQTNVVLSSLDELRAKTRDDVMIAELQTLEIRILKLLDHMQEFRTVEKRGTGFITSKLRKGVDGKLYFSMLGMTSILRMSLDNVRLGKFPVAVPAAVENGSEAHISCENFDEFMSAALAAIGGVEEWAHEQNSNAV